MKEKATITKVYSRPKKATMPTLLKFQNGSLSAIQKENTDYCRLRATQKNNTKSMVPQTAMVVANGQIYHGPIEGLGTTEQLTDNYICVRNKNTNKVRIIPIEQVRLNNDLYKQLEEKTSLINFSESHKRLMLLKQFGSRRAQRSIAKREDMKMNIDTIENELDNTLEDSQMENAPVPERVDHLDLIRPKFNKEATKLHEVYDINDVVSEELLDRLEEEAKVVFATGIDKLPIKSEFLRSCIKTRQSAAVASVEHLLHVKLIVYMDSLWNLIKTRVKQLSKVELSAISEKVENDVRRNFSDQTTKNLRTVIGVEKALCYFIVLSLLIGENYEVNISVLSQELCAPRAKILKYAQVVNARPKAGSDTLSLRLPNTVPALAKVFKRVKK